jgi:hypothetical protein
MTDTMHVGQLAADEYPAAFLYALDHPNSLWDIAFRTHIPIACQHLLFAVFFAATFGVKIQQLRRAFDVLHPFLCEIYGDPHGPKDFDEALRILEGGFIDIRGRNVDFVNPSLRDYLGQYLNDPPLLNHFAAAAHDPDWASAVWQQGKQQKFGHAALRALAISLLPIAEKFLVLPTWAKIENEEGYLTSMSNTRRIELLIEWSRATDDQRFADLASALAKAPVGEPMGWREGEEAVALVGELRFGDEYSGLPDAQAMADNFEKFAVALIQDDLDLDDLEKVSDAVERWPEFQGTAIADAIRGALQLRIDNIEDTVSDIDSKSTLDGYAGTLEQLAKRASIPPARLARVAEIVDTRGAELEAETPDAAGPDIAVKTPSEADLFDDAALKNLFAPLAEL